MAERYILDFEEPLRDIRQKIDEMQSWAEQDSSTSKADIRRLERQEKKLQKELYSKLNAWQRVQIARHPQRPHTLDYIQLLLTEFVELHGDRLHADDPAMICGFGRLEGQPVAVVGQQKGNDNESIIARNFGMPNPEGYRKAIRIMKLAEKFNRPVLTFIDTPGAFPGIMAEENGQGEAIARNLMEMSRLKVPVIATVIGEGGSGGALGIGVGDRVLILENSFYSVIAPESCAMILMRSTDKKDQLSESLKFSANDLKELGIVDAIIPEPVGGAHTDSRNVARDLKAAIIDILRELSAMSPEKLVAERIRKFRGMGRWYEK